MHQKVNIVIFASGSGTNAENIVLYLANNKDMCVKAIFTNNPQAGVIQRAQNHHVPVCIFTKEEYSDKSIFLHKIQKYNAHYIILAGFLWLIPGYLVAAYPDKIINIHPALLPKYGGKGMYGEHVHKAVKANNEHETGITIHYVNEHYDEGKIIFQARTAIHKHDTPDDIAHKVHMLEYEHYPKIIAQICKP
ncbi:MAG: phosphoribosylglycinamide formyltransferase [Cytophagales bacterium]|nr:phosphoribosylglycinamide formyltransferase [Cytophagales bacterium]